jgi:hypothetical protein
VTFSIEGTFTPTGGTPEPFSESKTWAGGKDTNNPDLITCTADVSETDETGTFEAHFEVTAVSVRVPRQACSRTETGHRSLNEILVLPYGSSCGVRDELVVGGPARHSAR